MVIAIQNLCYCLSDDEEGDRLKRYDLELDMSGESMEGKNLLLYIYLMS